MLLICGVALLCLGVGSLAPRCWCCLDLLMFCGVVLLMLLYAGLVSWFATWFMFWGLRGGFAGFDGFKTTGSSCWLVCCLTWILCCCVLLCLCLIPLVCVLGLLYCGSRWLWVL